MVIFKYHLTEEEYFEFNYYTAWTAPEKKGYRIRYYIRFIIWYILFAALYLVTVWGVSASGFAIFGIMAVVIFLLIPEIVKRSIRQRVRSTLSQIENRHVLQESEVILMDTGIIDKDTASETKYTWEAIVRKSETPSSYYLYTNTYHAIVIPKRVLGSFQDKLELQRLLNQHLPLSSEFPDQ